MENGWTLIIRYQLLSVLLQNGIVVFLIYHDFLQLHDNGVCVKFQILAYLPGTSITSLSCGNNCLWRLSFWLTLEITRLVFYDAGFERYIDEAKRWISLLPLLWISVWINGGSQFRLPWDRWRWPLSSVYLSWYVQHHNVKTGRI